MKPIVFHLFLIFLSLFCVWPLRRELFERPAGFLGWLLPPAIAMVVAGCLLAVSPGKRPELWAIAIVLGFAAGIGAGMILKATKDYERQWVKVQRTIDGFGAATLLFILAIARLVTSDLMNRPSGKFGVLGAAAAFLGCYLLGRALAVWFYNAPRTIHLDMTPDGYRKAG